MSSLQNSIPLLPIKECLYLIFFLLFLNTGFHLPAQIQPIKDIAPGSASSLSGTRLTHNGILQVGDSLFFWANDGTHGLEPWITDGTENGTRMLADIWPGTGGSDGVEGFIRLGDLIIFAANDSVHGEELWRYDLTSGAISLIEEMNAGPANAGLKLIRARCCQSAEVFAGHLYFSGTATPDEEDYELWRTDGQVVERVKDIYPGRISGANSDYHSADPEDFVVYKDHLYFEATTEDEGRAIWRTTGDPDSTEMFAYISFPGQEASGWWGQRVFNDKLLFVTLDYSGLAGGTGRELWVTDGNPDSVQVLRDILPGGDGLANHFYMDYIEWGDRLLFWATDSAHGKELWETDGTTAGTQLFAESIAGTDGNSIVHLYWTFIDSLLYVQLADDPFFNGQNILQSDGTTAGTNLINPDFLSPMFLPYVVEHEGLWFSYGDTDDFGRELYWSDGQGPAQMITDLNPGPGRAISSRLIKLGDHLIFSAFSPDWGVEWSTVDVQTLSVEPSLGSRIKIYPNPGRSAFSLIRTCHYLIHLVYGRWKGKR